MSGDSPSPTTKLPFHARCPSCRYSLAGLEGPGLCPECGRAFTPAEALSPPSPRTADTLLIVFFLLVALAAPLTACLWLTPGSVWTWIVAVTAVIAGLLAAPRLFRRHRVPLSKCPTCGYSWEGLPETGACPECGQSFETLHIEPTASVKSAEPTRPHRATADRTLDEPPHQAGTSPDAREAP